MSWMTRYFEGKGPFTPPRHILEALTLEQVSRRPQGAPHSLYEELWHVVYWQRQLLAAAKGEAPRWPERAAAGWPSDGETLDEERWQALVVEFFEGQEEARELAAEPEVLERRLERGAVGDRLGSLATHNAYHFGRMVLVRQLLGLWPPPSGGDTW